jgi:hypothetical protein
VPDSPADPLLTVRAAVILLMAFLVGAAAALLTYLECRALPSAALAGGGAVGGAILLFNRVIGR